MGDLHELIWEEAEDGARLSNFGYLFTQLAWNTVHLKGVRNDT